METLVAIVCTTCVFTAVIVIIAMTLKVLNKILGIDD